MNRLLTLVSGLSLAGSVFLVGMAIQMLAEAAADGWEIRNAGGITGLALWIAPFGIYPLVTAVLVGFAYFSSAWGRPIGVEVVLISGTLFAISMAGCAVSAHFTRDQVYLDGGRPGTVGAWVLHTGVAVFLAWFGGRALQTRKAEQAEDGDTSQRPC